MKNPSLPFEGAKIAMTLAAIAYANPANDPKNDIPFYLSQKHYATKGEWPLVWGPGLTTGNLMYVTKNNSSDTYAIAIRGTYPHFSLALLIDLYEDLDVGDVSEWKYPATLGALVANGTLDGLADLIEMKSDYVQAGTKLLDFIGTNVPAEATILVTGHSLGGCLTSAFAPWFRYKLGSSRPILPFTFAAPTAGNQTFVKMYDKMFPKSSRYYNKLDAIPNGFASLEAIKKLYPSPGPACRAKWTALSTSSNFG